MSDTKKTIDKQLYEDFFNSLNRNSPASMVESTFYSYYGYVRNMEALGKGYDEGLYNQASIAFEKWKKYSK
ncbi:MAG TPA: hypothetical protein VJ912_01375 [Candidatus Nanoarchaeia archaeon]|nr:hypothetical protein [Candidatus Nanoarchaeia archaeon]